MIFAIVNIILRLALTIVLTYKVTRFGHKLNTIERAGVGLMGGAGFLTIPLILDVNNHGTPFDGWSTSLFTMGALIYFCGRLTRYRRHDAKNILAVGEAKQYLIKRGMLK